VAAEEKILVVDLTNSGVKSDHEVLAVDFSAEKFKDGVDALIAKLKTLAETTNVVFVSDKILDMSTGMVIACSIRSLQTICKMRSMIKEGITEAEWTEKLIKKSFEENELEEKTEFEVIDKLVKRFESIGDLGKILADKMVSLCDEDTHLRNSVYAQKKKFETAESEDVKLDILSRLERYFFIVCIGIYIRELGEQDFPKSFAQWTQDNGFLSDMVNNGIRCWKDMTFFALPMAK